MKAKEAIRFTKFVLFSASAGLVEFGSYALLNEFTEWPYWPCYLIALVLSVIWNFTFNRKFTFRSNANEGKSLLLVFVYYAFFTPMSTLLGDFLADDLLWNGYLVTAINMLLNFVTEFLYQRIIVYGSTIDNTLTDEVQDGGKA